MTTPKLTPEDVADLRKTCELGKKLATLNTYELAALLDAWDERERLREALDSAQDFMLDGDFRDETRRAAIAAAEKALTGREEAGGES